MDLFLLLVSIFVFYFWRSGIALMYFELGLQENDASQRKKYFEIAQQYVNSPLEIILDAYEYDNKKKAKKWGITFLEGASGVLALSAVIFDKLGKKEKSQELIKYLVEWFSELTTDPTTTYFDDDLLYGRCGFLYSLLFVNFHITSHPVSTSIIANLVKTVMDRGKRGKCQNLEEVK